MPLIENFPDANLPEEVSVSADTASTTDMEPDNQTLQHGAISDIYLAQPLVVRMIRAVRV